ncbi:helix-turn-helix domain-containing protein [Nonomuraea sp. NPDC000554]|uniref:TetR/AcrR family transcriptional regulator n=1 Tax=Nonomuraea sp. NPDC000554 TaxID=3154259 RepID=UPI003334608A
MTQTRRSNDAAGRPRGGERTDAARNRARILAAAAEIVATDGIEGLTMAKVASASEVGVGTLYRRFGDRSGLAYALIDEREREFQQSFLTGPPPLGPGAPPLPRVRAFLHALTDRTFAQLDLLLMAETAGPFARFGGAYDAYHRHLSILIAEADPARDAPTLADALLAPLAANLVTYRLREHDLDPARLKAALDDLLSACLAARR